MATKKNSTKKSAGANAAAKKTQSPQEEPRVERQKLSLVKAALAVLADSEEALSARQIVEAAKSRGLWTPGAGKTPEQTLYSAFSREIKAKGENARIAVAGKGKFRLASH